VSFDHLKRLLEGRNFWGLVGSGILFQRSSDQKVCLFLRQGTMNSGTWGILGGKVDRGEDPKTSAIREAEEEAGGLPEGRFTGKTFTFRLELTEEDYLDGDSDFRRYAEPGEVFKYHTFLYQVEDDTWEPDLNWEHKEYAWFDPNDLPKKTLSLRDLEGKEVFPVAQAISVLTNDSF